jgi:RNA polymerase II subunit A-like phosphatase
MDNPPTPLLLPPTLSYPILVTRLLAQPNQSLRRGTSLLEYTFTSVSSRKALSLSAEERAKQPELRDVREYDMVGTWECPLEGEMVEWEDWLHVGTKVERKHIRSACKCGT